MKKFSIAIFFLSISIFTILHSEQNSNMKILMVGNSFTYFYGMPEIIKRLGLADNINIRVNTVLEGGATLQDLHEKGIFTKGLLKGPYDAAVLQKWDKRDQPLGFNKYLAIMVKELRKQNPGIKIFVYMTESGAVQISDSVGEHGSSLEEFRDIPPERIKEILSKYNDAISGLKNVYIVPCTLAWLTAAKERGPALQWYAGPNDGHPSPKRQYLTACMFHAVITGRNPVGNSYTSIGVPQNPEKAKWISDSDGNYIFQKWGRQFLKLKTENGKIKEVEVSALNSDDRKLILLEEYKDVIHVWHIPGNPYSFTETLRQGTSDEISYMQKLAWKTVEDIVKEIKY